jgi:RNA polymerase sigma factor (sigma-70 family)
VILYSDEEIITGIKQRDRAVLGCLYSKFYYEVRDWLSKDLSYHNTDMRDLFQEAMTVVFLNVTKKDFKLNSSFRTYLFSVVRNLLLVELKIKKKKSKNENIDEFIILNDVEAEEVKNKVALEKKDIIDELKQVLLWRKFEELMKDCRKILLMTINEANINEIAKKLGYKSGNYARKRRHFCKEYLRKSIKEDILYKKIQEYETDSIY